MDNAVFSPPGELARIGTRTVHWRRWGEASAHPPILLECGLTMMSSCWAWLAPELAKFTEVIAYDRAGLGWSEEVEGLRDARQIARELADALNVFGHRKFLFVGHSIGALYLRAFFRLHPESFAGAVLLDGSHPRQLESHRQLRRRTRNFFLFLEGASLLAGRGLPRLTLPFTDQVRHLPLPEQNHLLRFFRDPRHLRTSAREARSWSESASEVRDITFGELPLLILSAQKSAMPGWAELQHDFSTLSKHVKQTIFTNASHLSLLTDRVDSALAAEEIRSFVRKL